MKVPGTPKSDVWYRELLDDDRFEELYLNSIIFHRKTLINIRRGKDGTGDVYNPENIEDAGMLTAMY